jgi:cathepsin B
MRAVLVLALAAVAYGALDLSAPAIDQSIIDMVNNDISSTWRATANSRFFNVTLGEAKKLCGVLPDHKEVMARMLPVKPSIPDHIAAKIPDSFDSRDQWGQQCPSTSEIRDQAACGSCWAFGAVEAMTDRLCIATGGKNTDHLSAQDMNSCCASCGMGCGGGYPSAAWSYWQRTGLVTGGNYNSSQGCAPYTIPACDHHVVGKLPPCGPEVPTPACKKTCASGYPKQWNDDKHFAASAYSVRSRVADIQNEIMTHGPVEGAFTVFQDFLTYRSGVYKHTTGQELGGHAIKVLGWGVDGSSPYWIVANSWNPDWGDNGYFKILRGSDECGIEDEIVAGLPKV